MIILNSKTLKLNFVDELGIDRIKKASPQKTYRHRKIQLTFMAEGELLWKFTDGRKLSLRGGEFCLTQDGDTFSVGHGVLAPCYLIWIIFDPFAANAAKGSFLSERELKAMGKILADAGNPVRKASPAMLFHLKEIRKIIENMEGRKPDAYALLKLRLAIMSIFIESVESLSEKPPGKPPLYNGLDVRVRNLALSRPSHNFSVEEIAEHFKLSAGLFGKKFKRENGISPADFVLRVKFEEAIKRLKDSSGSITEISHALGFSSSQYFATVFKRYFGKTPKQFRKKI